MNRAMDGHVRFWLLTIIALGAAQLCPVMATRFLDRQANATGTVLPQGGNQTALSVNKNEAFLRPTMARKIAYDTDTWGKNKSMSQSPFGSTAASSGGTKPRIFFLFLAVDKVANLEVWESFFASAPDDLYMAYIHCKDPKCNAMVSGSRLRSVPTVPSFYCTDLVSPMNRLLTHALAQDGGREPHPQDKFAFVSDSTLPAKPFSELYASLSNREGSDFCVFPSSEWADVEVAGRMEVAPKHHQWVTLNREHAERASRLWGEGHWHDFMGHFQMNVHPWKWSNNSYGDQRNFGCLDEFWYLTALYGTYFVKPHRSSTVDMPQFENGPLHLDFDSAWQGACDTFVIWSEHMYVGLRNPFERLHLALDHHSIPHGGNTARPGWWDHISPIGIRAIRNSDFLFARKFVDGPQLVNGDPGESFSKAFIKIVLQ